MVVVEVLEEGECIKTSFPDERLWGSSAGVETSLPFINKLYLKSYPAEIFKQLIMHSTSTPT